MDNSLTIKNLSIALEALSRINQVVGFYDVESLLKREIRKAKEEGEAPKTIYDSDDIPF